MWVPLGVAWWATVSPEERSHYDNFIGPPTPDGWRVTGHEFNARRVKAEEEAKKSRDLALIRKVIDEHRDVLVALSDR